MRSRDSISAAVVLTAVLVLAACGGSSAHPSQALTRTLRGDLGAPGRYRLSVTVWTTARSDQDEIRVGPQRRGLAVRESAPSVVAMTVAVPTPELVVSVSGARRLPEVSLTATRVPGPGGAAPPSIALRTLAGGRLAPPGTSAPTGRSDGSVGARPAGLGTLSIAADVARRKRASAAARYRRLVWSDGFNGRAGGRPNRRDWRYDSGVWDQGSLDVDTASRANVRTDGHGRLVVTARRAGTGSVRPYTSGRIETAHRFSFTYGRLEARIKLPDGAGLWPTFWMLGDSIDAVGWPRAGEIDVMENFGQHPETVFGTIHGPVASGADSSFQIQSRATRRSLARGFHTYGVIWQPGRITWTLDGRAYGSARQDQLPTGSWVFNDQPFHIVLSLAVGGPDVGPPRAATRFPARLLVDWIRLYQ